ncbi:hypothetical protein [Pseudonocardia sp. WMMC193]|uniref:hypothetical protein n=1 Tax=Pseudonocardia sp. WMMC193 TaxID=2911965 RepID=UPI001F28F20E|nr:hypothetical protein [Pseudonocardia sp. WMMC193]MCF7547341.1 hypothetical protein [Pseudonocardia sp. WMMC193]
MADTDSPGTETAPPATVLERMLAAKISEERAREYLRNQWVRHGDEIITDPDAVLPKYVIKPPPITENT